MIRILKIKLETKLRKVVILLKRGNYNIYKVIEQKFKLITLGKYPFERWLKRMILFLFSIFTLIFIGKIYSFNFLSSVLNGILNPSPIVFKYYLLIFSIINFILILRYIIFIVSIYLISKGKLSKSIFKPFFLNNFIDRLQNFTSEDKLEFIIDYYYKHMYIYIVLFTFTMLLFFIMM